MRVLVTGATGQLGPYVVETLVRHGHDVIAWSGKRAVELLPGVRSSPVPLEDELTVRAHWAEARPDAVVHAAALARIDTCYTDPQRAHEVNVCGTERLCELADADRVPLYYVSTDLVFDGQKGQYREQDQPRPLSVYAQTKASAERVVLACPRNAVFRVSLLYGPGKCGQRTFFDYVLASWQQQRAVAFYADEWRSPLALIDAAEALRAGVENALAGLFHIGGPERLSRWEMGQRMAEAYGATAALLRRSSRLENPAPEPRPRDVSLQSTRFLHTVPNWQRHRFPEPWGPAR